VCGYIFIYVHQVYRCVYAEFTCVCAYIYIHVRQIHVSVCIYLHICTRACKCKHTCLCLYMCVWVYICCIYVCERTLWVHTDAVCAYANICIHIWVCTCAYMCVHLYICICMKRHRVCVQDVCIQIQAYMSVFVSCLRVCFKCVCRYIHIYVYARKTPWTHTDTLCAHRNTYIRICVCACVFI